MNTTQLLLLSGLMAPLFGVAPVQEGKTAQEQKDPAQEQKDKEKKPKAENLTVRFYDEEVERLTKEIEGSWQLFEYTNPSDLALEDVASGFATFHDGFVTLILAMDTVERRLFRARQRLALDTGAFRYRFDERGNLQLASVMSFTNQTEDFEMEREPPSRVREYYSRLEDGELELRDKDGVLMTFRKIEAGDFPVSAIRKIDRRRSGTTQWDPPERR